MRRDRRTASRRRRLPPGSEIDAPRSTYREARSPNCGSSRRPGRDLYWGVGGKALAPDPAATYTVLEIKRTGFSPGYTVAGPDKREWSAKLPPEAPTEVVASRIHWGLGYHQPPIYYLPKWRAEKTTSPQSATAGALPGEESCLPGRPRGDRALVLLSESLRRHARAQRPDRAAGDARQLGSQG